ncbi:hypothetical protein Moror_10910 [Moniliophthora roreri MCA 2997]|uniref:Uncharacterized protein n=1 Tax=Moniliophthora roreri (strain MCA 2997) TaxID=1381753 RepID=V2WKW1_MONRO|nr:hypothetical protein Moror_10910 [Moniliophthora roreri MCA 2997]
METLRALSDIISNNVDTIEKTCKDLQLHFPSPTNLLRPVAICPTSIPKSSKQPPVSVFTASLQFGVPAALRTAIETNTVEILREAGPQGLHVKDIAARNGTHPGKLGRILRLLATEHIFKEVSPDVFANNRISSVVDTYKSVAEIQANPKDKHVGTSGMAAIATHFTDEAFKASAFMAEGVTRPGYALSDDPTKTAFNIAFQTDMSVFPWYELPENQDRLRTFGLAMEGGKNMFNPQAILEGFDWSTISGGTVVDVGGGIGSQSLIVAKAFPSIKFVVQDRPAVIKDAEKFWADAMPEALQSGRVVLSDHDFFQDQPVRGADVYYLRMILHDWADSYCLQILKKLKAAAGSTSKLLIVDSIMSYACEDMTVAKEIPGGIGIVPPKPLLPNWGHASAFNYMADTQMMSIMNGTERTLAQLDDLLHRAGWKVDRVYRGPELASAHQQVLAVPL